MSLFRRQGKQAVDIDLNRLSEGLAEATNRAMRDLVERQDAAAARADEIARTLSDERQRAANYAEEIMGQLGVIHTLVNSNMTAALQSELDATEDGLNGKISELAMMREVLEIKRLNGHEPSKEALAAIETTLARIKALEVKSRELRAGLNDRLKQSDIVEAQVLADAESGRTDRES